MDFSFSFGKSISGMETLIFSLLLPLLAHGKFNIPYELTQNKLNASYGINFKYNGKLHHSIDRVWVITKFKLPQVAQLHFPSIGLEATCTQFTSTPWGGSQEMHELKHLCSLSKPFIKLLHDKEAYFKKRALDILEKDVFYALHASTVRQRRSFRGPNQNFSKSPAVPFRNKRFIGAIVPVLAGLATIAVESLGAFLQKKRHSALKKGLHAIETDQALINNVIKALDKDMLMYGKFTLDSLDSVTQQLHTVSERTNDLERILGGLNASKGELSLLKDKSLTGRIRYSHMIHTYFDMVSERHIRMYEELVRHLDALLRAIRTLTRGYIPSELFSPSLLRNVTAEAVSLVRKEQPDYVSVLTRPTDYYDMKLVTFGLDARNDLVVAFPIFVQNKKRTQMRLYELETVKVPILDKNTQADSYTEISLPKPYIAMNRDYYIELRIQELRMCKQIRHSYLCEELFLVKHKSKPSCASSIFHNSPPEIVTNNCKFLYYYNTTVTPSVLDGGHQILLANMLSSKKLVCAQDHALATPLPKTDFVLVNRSILCNCHLDADFVYLLKSISSCTLASQKFQAEFTVNLAFMTIFAQLLNITSLHVTNYIRETPFEFPIHLNNSLMFIPQPANHGQVRTIVRSPATLHELRTAVAQHESRIGPAFGNNFLSHPRQEPRYPEPTYGNYSFVLSMPSHWFYMLSCITSTCFILPQLYLAVKHKKLHAWVAALAVYRTSACEALPIDILTTGQNRVVCTQPWLSLVATVVTIVGACFCIYKYVNPMSLIKGTQYARVCVLYVFVTYKCRYVPIKIATSKGLLCMFALHGEVVPSDIRLKKNLLWDTIHIDWKNILLTYNKKSVPLSQDITVSLWDKMRVRRMFGKKNLSVNIMIRQGNTWFSLADKQAYKNVPSSSADRKAGTEAQ